MTPGICWCVALCDATKVVFKLSKMLATAQNMNVDKPANQCKL